MIARLPYQRFARAVKVRAGEGESGELGGPAGDLFVVMAIEQHDLFQRDGVDLHIELPISVFQAMLGATVPLATILGEKKTVEVDSGSQPGAVLRLKGLGMPHVNSNRRGDLFAFTDDDIIEWSIGQIVLVTRSLIASENCGFTSCLRSFCSIDYVRIFKTERGE